MNTVEETRAIKLQDLKRFGYLRGSLYSGNLEWTSSYGEKNSAHILVNTFDTYGYIELSYTRIDHAYNREKEMSFRVTMEPVKCNFGGKRWMFICPLAKNGEVCRKRIRALYPAGDYYGCRLCADLIYHSQTVSGNQRNELWKLFDLEEYYDKNVGREYYRGKITSKYKTYLRKAERYGLGDY